MQNISCGGDINCNNNLTKSSNSHSQTVVETKNYENDTFSYDLIDLKEEGEADDEDENNSLNMDLSNNNIINFNLNKQIGRKSYLLSSSSISTSSSSSTTSSSSSSISPVPFSCSNNKKNFKHKYQNNQQNVKVNYSKCICKLDQKQFDCFQCTQNYPINVRRSKDGEEDNKYFYSKNDTNLDNNKVKVLYNTMHTNDSSTSSEPSVILLKPSPIPVSSSLLSLLALTKPSNTFVPPPNKCLVQSHLFNKNSSSSSHSNKK